MFTQKTVVRHSALSMLLGLALLVPLTAAVVSDIRIDNFGKVNANYFRGAQPTGGDFADLKALGVKLVIDLAAEGDKTEGANAEAAGMKFVRIPLTTGRAPSQAAIDQFLTLVDDPTNQPVYVHCMGGRHRTGTLTAVYRMRQDGWTADQAFSEMKRYRFGADFLHPELKEFVYSYFKELNDTPAPGLLAATETPVLK